MSWSSELFAPLPPDALLEAVQTWELQRLADQLGAITSALTPISN